MILLLPPSLSSEHRAAMRLFLKVWFSLFIMSMNAFGVSTACGAEQRLDEAMRMDQQGFQAVKQARYTEAEALFKRSIEILEQRLGQEHLNVAITISNLAAVYRQEGKIDEAVSLYRRALSIFEKRLGMDHPKVIVALNTLASTFEDESAYEDARQLYNRVLTIQEKRLGADNPNITSALRNIANIYIKQKSYDKAEPYFARALQIREKRLGPEQLDLATSLIDMGLLYNLQSRYNDATPLFSRALEIRIKRLGDEHLDVASALENIAETNTELGRYDEAAHLYERALKIQEKRLGKGHLETAVSLGKLASTNERLNHFDKAEIQYKQALSIEEGRLGATHANVVMLQNNLVRAQLLQNHVAEAVPLVSQLILENRSDPLAALRVMAKAGKDGVISRQLAFENSFAVFQQAAPEADPSMATDYSRELAEHGGDRRDEFERIIREEQDLAAEKRRVEKAVIDANAERAPNKYVQIGASEMRARLKDIDIKSNIVARKLAQSFPGYPYATRLAPLTLAKTQELLADDEAVFGFMFIEEDLYVWVVTENLKRFDKISGNIEQAKNILRQLSMLNGATVDSLKQPTRFIEFYKSLLYSPEENVATPLLRDIAQKRKFYVVIHEIGVSPNATEPAIGSRRGLAVSPPPKKEGGVIILPSIGALYRVKGRQ